MRRAILWAAALLVVSLPLKAAEGTLRVKADVAGAEVFLDGKSVGVAPLTLAAVAAGAHKLVLIKPGYEDHAEDVEVREGQVARVFVVMKQVRQPLPALPVKFYAIHQHRAGACSGILTITGAGLEYRSHDGHDVFQIPLEQIRSVSRSMGASAGMYGVPEWGVPPDYTGLRIEVPGRNYGFFAYDEDPALAGTPAEKRITIKETAVRTREAFGLVYRLWSDLRETKSQPGALPR